MKHFIRRLCAQAWLKATTVALIAVGPGCVADTPNIVVIYADDLGYGDVGCYNPQRGKIATPNIDRLARQGMRFTDGHASSSVCSPSRYTLLTGRYHWRSRLQRGIVDLWEPPLISPDRMTIGSLAQEQGYRTACIGKWHLGWDWPIAEQDRQWFRSTGYGGKKDVEATDAHRKAWHATFSQPIVGGPTSVGFDEYFGTDVPNWPPFCFIENDRTIGIPNEYAPTKLFAKNQASLQGPALAGWTLEPILPALGDRAVGFIEREANTPDRFLLYLSLTAPHTPHAVNESWKGSSGLNAYADFVMETDAIVGRVLDALRDQQVADDTLVLFTSDNGFDPRTGAAELERRGHYPSGPLRGYKFGVWEGGHRVPFVVRWPGVVEPGSRSDRLVHQADLLATIAEILGVTLPDNAAEDSFSLVPLLKGNDVAIRETSVSSSNDGTPSLRHGEWKYIAAFGRPAEQLYNLATDLGESKNLAANEARRVAEMRAALNRLIADGRSTPGTPQPNDVEVRQIRSAD